jgi:Protein of unknown function (DUF3000)
MPAKGAGQRAVADTAAVRRTLRHVATTRGADQPAVDPADRFARTVRSMHTARLRAEVVFTEAPAPQRVAPYAAAFTADVADKTAAQHSLATGRLILLHDPAGHEAWHGQFRLVCYARAALDAEMTADPLFGRIGWSWLVEALGAHAAAYTAPSGTVTRVSSESFGAIAGEVATAEMEIRASWTPLDAETASGLASHVEAFGDLLATVAGLPPVGDGAVLPLPRAPRPR